MSTGNDNKKDLWGPKHFMGTLIEYVLFSGRWIMAPVYLGMLVTLLVLAYKFVEELIVMVEGVVHSNMHEITLEILGLLDITLLANLILIIVFSGYENFVSKIGVAENSEDRPAWMGHVDYSGLKIKLVGSLVAISVIELLKDFMEPEAIIGDTQYWRVVIHITFVVSGLLFALMDYMADKRHTLNAHGAPAAGAHSAKK
jgi:uncharacterized protein (TIGR00645 family)